MKYKLGISALMVVSLLGACSNDDQAKDEKSATTAETTESETTTKEAAETVVAGVTLTEPAKDEVCAFCNMKAYSKSDELGAFTAQAVDEKGKNLFFDDAGCMLNYEREHNVDLEKFVRNYDDKSWMKLDDAIVVKGDFKTPMKYGFAYFKDEKSAQAFIAEQKTEAKIVDEDMIDDVAHEKYKAKMGDSHDSHDHETEDHDTEDHDATEHDSGH